eukprot:UN05599
MDKLSYDDQSQNAAEAALLTDKVLTDLQLDTALIMDDDFWTADMISKDYGRAAELREKYRNAFETRNFAISHPGIAQSTGNFIYDDDNAIVPLSPT